MRGRGEGYGDVGGVVGAVVRLWGHGEGHVVTGWVMEPRGGL